MTKLISVAPAGERMRHTQTIFSLAHRYLWQSLPGGARRAALIALASRCAPRPSPAPSSRGPIIIAGFLTAATGLGASARLCYEALRETGHRVLGIDLSAQFRQDDARVEFPFDDGSRHSGPGCLVLHVNSPFVPLALWRIGRSVVTQKLVLGCWAWELPTMPAEWLAGVPFVHRVLVPSRFTRDAVRALAPDLNIEVLSYPASLLRDREQSPVKRPNDTFTALVVFNLGSGFQRKNPLAAVQAFRKAFGNDPATRLIIKMLNAKSFPADAHRLHKLRQMSTNLEIDERNLSPQEMSNLYDRADVVLSLHRSEGFGLVVAEAMLAGRPVICTDWSGSTDFLTSETGIPIPYRLVPAIDPGGEYHNPEIGVGRTRRRRGCNPLARA